MLFEGLVRYFRDGIQIQIEQGELFRDGEGHCVLPVIFHGDAKLHYELRVRMEGPRAVAQVQAETIHDELEVLESIEGPSMEALREQAASLYAAIDMDLRRVFFTSS